MIGDNVEIIILEFRAKKVRIGINAPKNIPIHRGEIYDALQRERDKKNAEEPAETSRAQVSPIHCSGAYGSTQATQKAYIIENKSGRRLKCSVLEGNNCNLGYPKESRKCLFYELLNK